MHKTFLAAAITAATFAVPAFAQVSPTTGTTTKDSAQAGVSATGTPANTGVGVKGAATDASGQSTLGLGGLLKQAQAGESATDAADDGAGPTGSLSSKAALDAKTRAKARAHGH